MSQRELAEAVGYATKSSMNKIEAGETSVPLPRLTEIAKVLRVPVNALMDEPSDDVVMAETSTNEAVITYAQNSTSDTAKKLRDHLLSAMKLLEAEQREESEVSAKFKRLTPANQTIVMTMIDTMLAQQK
jgi:transcriptional regulator with XRE-family HTH domain